MSDVSPPSDLPRAAYSRRCCGDDMAKIERTPLLAAAEALNAAKEALDAPMGPDARAEALDSLEASIASYRKATEAALYNLFHGRKKTVKGKLVVEYLTGEEEREALRLLAAHIRQGTLQDKDFCIALSRLFDPDTSPTREPRRVVFVPRRQRGRKGHEDITPSIARDLLRAALKGQNIESAVAIAVERYGVSRRTVMRVWSDYRAQPGTAEWIHREKERLRSSVK